MYDVIQLGRFTIYVPYLIHVASALLATGWVYLAGNRHFNQGKSLSNEWLESWMMSVLIWKFSYALFHPLAVIENPSFLLYFSGGTKGLILGFAVGIVYFLFKTRNAIPEFPLRVVLLGSAGVLYYGITTVTEILYTPDVWWIYILKVSYFSTLPCLIWKREWFVTKISQIRLAEWFLFGWILFKIVTDDVYLNDITFWVMFVLAFVLVIMDIKDGMKK